MSSQWGSQKLLQGLASHEFTAYLSIFNQFKLNEWWLYYQKHVNQIILNRTTLDSLALRIFEAFVRILLIANLSLNQTLLTFLLCVRQTWMTQLILAISLWEVIFLWSERILALICMVLQVMLKKDFITGLISRKLSIFLLMFLTGFTSRSVFFFLYRSSSWSLCTVFYSISCNIDEFLLINPSANVFVFGDFNMHHKGWHTYSGVTDWLGELRWLTFLCGS